MANIREEDEIRSTEKRKKTTIPKGILKSEGQKEIELCLKVLRGYY